MDYPKSVPGVGLVNGKFIDEDPLAAKPGSLIPSAWGNAVTQEILNVIASTGVSPDEGDFSQLVVAIDKKITDVGVTFATQEEAEAGTNSEKVMSPLRVFQAIAKIVTQATETSFGWLKIGTQVQVNAGVDDTTAVTPKKLASWFTSKAQATESSAGVAKIATAAQVVAGVDDATIVTPKKLFGADPWSLQPLGVPIAVFDHIVGSFGSLAPPTGKAYRYIKLTASDAYNSGVLGTESVSGSAPLVVATAVITYPASPINGVSVNLINTERRVLRAGLSGSTDQDALQGHWHNVTAGGSSGYGLTSGGSTAGNAGIDNTIPAGGKITGPANDGTNGAVRVANETRAKSIGVTYYMRIL